LPTVLNENNNHSVSHYYVFRHKLVHFWPKCSATWLRKSITA